MVIHAILEDVLTKVVDYCARDETKAKLEAGVLAPAMQYLADKFSWGVRLFQAVAILVFVQTLMLLWLLFRDVRRSVHPAVPTPFFSS